MDLINYLKCNKTKSFNELLFYFIDRSGKKDSNIYRKANIDRKLFSKIRCNYGYTPSKKVILKLGISLKLDKNEVNLLLKSAGYSLRDNDDFDLIISYCIENNIYDIDIINDYLFNNLKLSL